MSFAPQAVSMSGITSVRAHSNMGLSLATVWMMAVMPVAPPVGSMVYFVRDLTTNEPGEMRAVGQALLPAREDFC